MTASNLVGYQRFRDTVERVAREAASIVGVLDHNAGLIVRTRTSRGTVRVRAALEAAGYDVERRFSTTLIVSEKPAK